MMVAIEGKAGSSANKNTIRPRGCVQIVGHPHCLVEQVVKDLQPRIVDEEETHTGFIENRSQEFLVRRKSSGWRPHARQIVEGEDHTLARACDTIEQGLESFDLDPPRRVENGVD